VVVAVSVLAAGIAYAVSRSLPASYQSSATFRVTVPNQQGVNDSVVTAANDLASQYAQLVDSTPVLDAAATTLHVPASSLNGKIGASTVNAQNLVQVTASAATPAVAEARASAAVYALVEYLDTINAKQGSIYAANASKALAPIDRTLTNLTRRLGTDKPGMQASDAAVLASLLSQRQQVLDSLATNVAAGLPTLQVISPGNGASQVSPRPKLYALITFVVVLLIAARIGYLLFRRASRAALVRAQRHGAPSS